MSNLSRHWFQPGDGIAREVITADIQRYLGRDATVRPGMGRGEYEGVPGYWITAYRNLTSEMVADLQLDSRRWQQQEGRVRYENSQVHQSRQYHGPTPSAGMSPETPSSYAHGSGGQSYAGANPAAVYGGRQPVPAASYGEPNYVYGSQNPGYGQAPNAYYEQVNNAGYQPRTTSAPAYQYSNPPGGRESDQAYIDPRDPSRGTYPVYPPQPAGPSSTQRLDTGYPPSTRSQYPDPYPAAPAYAPVTTRSTRDPYQPPSTSESRRRR